MAFCPPSCIIPSYATAPQFGLGSAGGSGGASAGGLGLGGRSLGGGLQGGSMGGLQGGSMGSFQGGSMEGLAGGLLGGGVSSGELGILSGFVGQPMNHIPPSEVVIQPSPIIVIIPGPFLSASGKPPVVGGYTPLAAPGSRILGMPLATSRGMLGGRNPQGGHGNVPFIPCDY